ncbi:MAG: amidase family protein [Solirubrobacterales bacterium]
MDEQLAFAGSARLAELLRAREISSRELTELYLSRIEHLDPKLNSFLYVSAEKALVQADEADRRLGAGEEAPFLGVPIAIKDVEDMEGEPTRLGTDAFDGVADSDSPMVASLRHAGAVFLGKTNLPELAICGFTESKTTGVTRNPWDVERTPSGSSGGSAAAVAAGLCAAASASDGAGSIRNPAAFCNLFGLKPQRGRIPMGAREHWRGLSVTGAVTRTVMDTAIWLDATMAAGGAPGAPPPPNRPYAEAAATPPEGLRVALSTKPARVVAPPMVNDEAKRGVADAGELLRSLGHDAREADPSYGLAGSHLATRYLGGIHDDVEAVPFPERLESRTRGFGRLGSLYRESMVRSAVDAAEKDARRINEIFCEFDVLITPVVGEVAFPVRRWEGKGALRTLLGMSRSFCFAGVWNHTGQPAAAVPIGFTDAGLPRSVQIVAPPNREDVLLSVAAQIEAEKPWATLRPPVS